MRDHVNRFETAIVVDRSSIARQLLSTQLHDHCNRVVAVGSVRELRDHLGDPGVSLVVIDASSEGAMDWLEEVSRQRERPAVLVVTHAPSRHEETHATLLGAIGYLTKPITVEQLARALASSS
jgi:DNA-binding NtrC family response regulator